jgi:MFS family permease
LGAAEPATDEGAGETVLLAPAELARGFALLTVTTFAATIALNIAQAIGPNFLRQELGMDGAQNGYLIAIREIPGFLLILVAAALLKLGMSRATTVSLITMGVGYSLFAVTNSFASVIVPSVIGSIGFHSWLQLQDALGLSLARPGEEGSVLGKFRGIGFAGTLVALIGVWIILFVVGQQSGDLSAVQGPWLRGLYVVSGICAVVGAIAIVRFPSSQSARASARAAPAITWRREYGLYYWLSFLDGSRMQIYFAFAPFVLVEEFGIDAVTLTALLIVSALLSWQAGPIIGKMVDRYGEKRMLTIGYSFHLLVFLGFALSRNVWLLYLTYVGYNVLFLFSIGTTTYLRKICRREDLAPSLAMGVSLSHMTAVVVPIVGAALWQRLGYQFPFLFGTVFIFISIWLTQKIDVANQRVPGAPPLAAERHIGEEEMSADGATFAAQTDGQVAGPIATLGLADEQVEDAEMAVSKRAGR